MSTQVITVGPDGRITSLTQKKGQGVDVRKFGKAQIERTTLIEWVEPEQAWEIRFLKRGPYKGVCTAGTFMLFASEHKPSRHYLKSPPWWLSLITFGFAKSHMVPVWRDYEDAVKAEIEMVQNMRALQGVGIV